ncbi:MAG TPA: hypothetical protein VF989_04295 [Polyangiaceae bacterium]
MRRASGSAPSIVLIGCAVACGGNGDGASSGSGATGAAGAGGSTSASSSVAGSSGGSSGTGGSPQGGGAGTDQGGGAGTAQGGTDSLGLVPVVAGCPVFTADDAWNTDVSEYPADADATARLRALVGDVMIHPDYGNDGDTQYGIPFNVVPENQPLAPVSFDAYPEESDPGPYPFPDADTADVEGFSPTECDGDCHLLVVAEGACMLYEGYACQYENDGWHCSSGASWELERNSYGQRPEGWTSADAAGLPILPGLLRYDEVARGEIHHALRFTLPCTTDRYVAPATHFAVPGSCDADDPNAPPMGLRVRLQADFETSEFPADARAVLEAMKRYGMILADNGSSFYFQGEAHPDWSEQQIEPLKDVPASAFEVVMTLGPGP